MCGTEYLSRLTIAYRNVEVSVVVISGVGGEVEQQIANGMNRNGEPDPQDLASCTLER